MFAWKPSGFGIATHSPKRIQENLPLSKLAFIACSLEWETVLWFCDFVEKLVNWAHSWSSPCSIGAWGFGASGRGSPAICWPHLSVITLHLLLWRKMLAAFSLQKTSSLNILGGVNCLRKELHLVSLNLDSSNGYKSIICMCLTPWFI